MTNRDKNLIKLFLELSGLNKNTFKKEEKILKELVYLTNYLPQDKKIKQINFKKIYFVFLNF